MLYCVVFLSSWFLWACLVGSSSSEAFSHWPLPARAAFTPCHAMPCVDTIISSTRARLALQPVRSAHSDDPSDDDGPLDLPGLGPARTHPPLHMSLRPPAASLAPPASGGSAHGSPAVARARALISAPAVAELREILADPEELRALQTHLMQVQHATIIVACNMQQAIVACNMQQPSSRVSQDIPVGLSARAGWAEEATQGSVAALRLHV